MKKKVTVLVVIYILFLLLGLWFNLQRGVADYDQFWKLKQDGWYTSPAGDRIRYSSTSGFDMILNDRSLSASLTRRSDGGYRVAFSDGWALETANFPYLAIEVGGVWLSHDLVYELTDLDAAGLSFAPAVEQIEPIYDGSNQQIGQFVHLVTSTGESVDYREIFSDQPEISTPEREKVVLKNGIRIQDADIHNVLFTNEKGDYLLRSDELTMINVNGGQRSRSTLIPLMINISEGKVEQRGHVSMAFPFTLLYLVGVLSFLYPEKAAFFGSRWKYQNEPELSDMGMLSMQLGSIVMLIIAVAMLFLPIL